jgi:hypothetical protein
MNQDQPLTWNVHRTFDAPVDDTIPALDLFALYASLRPTSPYARLLARPTAGAASALPDKPSRCFTGRLAIGISGPAVPIEVDLTPWSPTRSVLGVRPRGSRPPRRRQNPYFPVTHALVDDLTLKLNLLIHLDGGPRSETAHQYARVLTASLATPNVARFTRSSASSQ